MGEIPGEATRCGTCGRELAFEPVASHGHIAIGYLCPEHGQVAALDPL
jgi:hypothetical protein